MANSIDQLNYYDPLVKKESLKMSEQWIAQLSALIDTLNGYLTPFGLLTPQLSTSQRDSIQSPVNGQIIYNTDTNEFQGWKVSAWVVIA